jgi:pimeloyl-ACP methyl ester carboxylesterase
LLVVVVPMALELAVLNVNEAADVMEAFPEIEHWAVGGHSLGAAMAASFADRHRDQVGGLVLWAAYPESGCHRPRRAARESCIRNGGFA